MISFPVHLELVLYTIHYIRLYIPSPLQYIRFYYLNIHILMGPTQLQVLIFYYWYLPQLSLTFCHNCEDEDVDEDSETTRNRGDSH